MKDVKPEILQKFQINNILFYTWKPPMPYPKNSFYTIFTFSFGMMPFFASAYLDCVTWRESSSYM